MKEKVILVDCDGVLVDWLYSFDRWMIKKGYVPQNKTSYEVNIRYNQPRPEMQKLVRFFNESAEIRFLTPFRDAIYFVNKLHKEHGYVFHCITSLSDSINAALLREKNLQDLFGKTVFEKIVCLDCGADKDYVLSEYIDTGCYWIEDKVENAEVGAQFGLNSILIAHDYNTGHSDKVLRMSNWKEIYNHITQ